MLTIGTWLVIRFWQLDLEKNNISIPRFEINPNEKGLLSFLNELEIEKYDRVMTQRLGT